MPGQEMPGGIGIGLAFLAEGLLRNWKENLFLLGIGFSGFSALWMSFRQLKILRKLELPLSANPPSNSLENSSIPHKITPLIYLITGIATWVTGGLLLLQSGSPSAILILALAVAVTLFQAKGNLANAARVTGKVACFLALGGLALAVLAYGFRG